MPTEHHLVTPFKLTTSATLSTSTDAVTLTAYGMRAGQGFYFLSDSTALPSIGGTQIGTTTKYYISTINI